MERRARNYLKSLADCEGRPAMNHSGSHFADWAELFASNIKQTRDVNDHNES
jgi:hypothetical protein